MTAGKAKPYYASHAVHDFYTKLGNGNRSKGAQVAAAYHGRLVEALRNALACMESDLEQIESEWGEGRSLEALEREGKLTEEILEARTLLASLEAEKGGE